MICLKKTQTIGLEWSHRVECGLSCWLLILSVLNVKYPEIQTVTKHDSLIHALSLSSSDYYYFHIWRTCRVWNLIVVRSSLLVMCVTTRWRSVVMRVSSEAYKRNSMLHDMLEHLHENPCARADIKVSDVKFASGQRFRRLVPKWSKNYKCDIFRTEQPYWRRENTEGWSLRHLLPRLARGNLAGHLLRLWRRNVLPELHLELQDAQMARIQNIPAD